MGRGLPSFTLTGLPGTPVQDARDRIRPAVEHAGLEWPLRRVVVNLAPGNAAQGGSRAWTCPSRWRSWWRRRRCPSVAVAGWAFAGELSLKGDVLPTPGHLVRRHRGGARRTWRASSCRRPTRWRRPRSRASRWSRRRTLADVAGFLRGTWPPPRDRAGRRAAPSGVLRGPLRRARAASRSARARGRRGGRPQPADGRLARRRQDHAGAAARHDPAGPDPGGGAGGQPAALGGGPPGRRRTAHRAARSVRPITPSPPQVFWVEAASCCGRARSASPPMASCSWTS